MDDEAASRAFLIAELTRIGRNDAAQKAWEQRGKACPIQRPMKDRWRS